MLTKSEALGYFINITLYTLIFKSIDASLFRIIIYNKRFLLKHTNNYQ